MSAYLLGPCRCQGCGREVAWLFDGRHLGWLHENGSVNCRARRLPDTTQRAYWRVVKARWREMVA